MLIFKLVANINTSTSAWKISTWNVNDSLHANIISFLSTTRNKKRTCFGFPSLHNFCIIDFSPFRFVYAHNPAPYERQEKYLLLLDIHKFSVQIGCCKYCTTQDIYKYFSCSLIFKCWNPPAKSTSTLRITNRGKKIFCWYIWGYSRYWKGNQEINVAKEVAWEGHLNCCHIYRKFSTRRKFMLPHRFRIE